MVVNDEYYRSLPRTNTHELNARQERRQSLNKEWELQLPCIDCELKDICKHYNTISRVNFNSEVFEIRVSCKVREERMGK